MQKLTVLTLVIENECFHHCIASEVTQPQKRGITAFPASGM